MGYGHERKIMNVIMLLTSYKTATSVSGEGAKDWFTYRN